MTIQTINTGLVVNDKTGDPLRTAYEKINANFSDANNAASKEVGLDTGQLPTAGQLSMVGQTVNYTGANYQPEVVNGIGVVRLMRNVSGTTVPYLGTVDGSLLKQAYFTTSGVITENGSGGAGNDWRNVSGLGSSDDTFVYMERFA